MGRPKPNPRTGKLVQGPEELEYDQEAQDADPAPMPHYGYHVADATTEVPLSQQIKDQIAYLTDEYTEHIKNLRYAEKMLKETNAENTVNSVKQILNITRR